MKLSSQNPPLRPRRNLGSVLSACRRNRIKTAAERHDGSHLVCLRRCFLSTGSVIQQIRQSDSQACGGEKVGFELLS